MRHNRRNLRLKLERLQRELNDTKPARRHFNDERLDEYLFEVEGFLDCAIDWLTPQKQESSQ